MTGPVARQRAFERDVHAALRARLKGTGWKFAQEMAFRELDGWFVRAWPRLALEPPFIDLAFKPMAIDPLFWTIFAMPENGLRPLSFRANAAFQCRPLPLHEESLAPSERDPAVVAETITRFCVDRVPTLVHAAARQSFSQSVREHPQQHERGVYAVTLVTALILEERLDEARTLAARYASGELQACFGYTSGDRSFHDFALEWLGARPA